MEFYNPASNSNENSNNTSSNLSQSNDSTSNDASSANDVAIKQENPNDDSQASSNGTLSTPNKDQTINLSSCISSPTSNTSHQRLFSKPEKPETKPTRTSPRRIERPITYNVNIDLSKQLKLTRKEPPSNHQAPLAPPSSLHKNVDLNQNEAKDCEGSKEEQKCREQTDSIQLRPSPRRQTRRMQSRSSPRSTFLRVDKGIFAFELTSSSSLSGNKNNCCLHWCLLTDRPNQSNSLSSIY